jgi:hypothetical protein
MVVLSEAPWGLSTLILSPEALSDSFAKLGKLLGSEHEQSNPNITHKCMGRKIPSNIKNLHWVRSAAYTIPTRSRCFSFLK